MQLKSWVFGNDPQQALRIRRLFLATATYYLISPFIIYAIWQGLIRDYSPAMVIVLATAPCAVFYPLIRSGFSLRFADPSLTLAQMLVATALNMNWIYHATDARGALLVVHMVILVFGIFRLGAKGFIVIGLFSIAAYGCMILYQIRIPGNGLDLQVEILHWLALVLIYPWFAWIGGYMSNSRRRLKEVNMQLAAALEENKAALKVIEKQAIHDELTGIYNRRYLMAAIDAEVARSQRTGASFGVLILDIDHFKTINDRLGHLVGDKVLKRFADVVASELRTTDCFSRYGGEEFCILMPNMTMQGSASAAERLRERVAQTSLQECGASRITVSIGVSEYYPGRTVEDLLASADQAMYRAKQNGRNRVEIEAPARRASGDA